MTPALVLEAAADRSEVLRMLGYRRGEVPSARVVRRLDELWPRAEALVRARGAWRIVDAAAAESTGVPAPTPLMGIGLCTVGVALEEEAKRCSDAGRTLDALLLDAYGSVAAEAAADEVNHPICATATARGYDPMARISPGYGGWDVRAQPALVGLLPAAEVGVRLTEGMMMAPNKSVSFAVRFRIQPSKPQAQGRRCGRCGMRDCAYRDTEEAP